MGMEGSVTTLKVTAKGQVTLRKSVLHHVGIRYGDQIEVELLPGGRVLLTAGRPAGTVEGFIGVLAGKTRRVASIEDMNEAIAQGWSGKE